MAMLTKKCAVCYTVTEPLYLAAKGNWFCPDCAVAHGVPVPAESYTATAWQPDRFVQFCADVQTIVGKAALEKGYAIEGADGDLLTQFVETYFSGHALGEVVYKAVRYRAKQDPTDLVKIAAWAYLVWKGGNLAAHAHAQAPADEAPALPLAGPLQEVLTAVAEEAVRAMVARPRVREADPVRLVGLVSEEVGEAMKEALDITRLGPSTSRGVTPLYVELVQTAAMAVIAAMVIKEGGRA